MSRFYNALKEVSRLAGEREPVSPPESRNVPATPEAVIAGLDHIVEPAATSIVAVEEEIAARAHRNVETLHDHDFLPSHADVSMDQTARLIPHAVDSAVVEHYRKLRTKILQQHKTKAFKSLVVTSPNPEEGKSVTALNLGLSFAMLPNFRVVVVDGDLRKGSLGKWLGVDDRPGLGNLIDGSAQLEDVVLKSDESPMCFVVRGTSEAAPGELLNSSRVGPIFRGLGEHFDLIVVDSPPVNLITDTQLLAAGCDAVLLVARAYSTKSKSFEKTVQDLSPFRIIGTVLNGGVQLRRRYYGYGHGYYGRGRG